MSIIDTLISEAKTYIADKQAQIDWLREHRHALESVGVKQMSLCGLYIDVDHPGREEVLALIKALPGDWEKSPAGEGRINYESQIDGMTVRLYSAEPPPSCKLIEEEVEIPAQPARKEKRLKLVCKEEA